METLGSLAGTTLGWIIGNTDGAWIGEEIGRKAAMAYIRKRKTYRRPTRGPMKRRRMSAPRKPRASTNITTLQKDYTTQYVKRRMPRYKRIAWKKFSNKVKAVNIKNKGLKTVIYNESATCAVTQTAQQGVGLHLYGVRGSSTTANSVGGRDLLKLFTNDPTVVQGAGGSNPKVGKLIFNSGSIDVTLHNTGIPNLEVDVYYGYHTKDVVEGQMVTNFIDPTIGVPINSGVPNQTLSILQRGVTPFDLSSGLSASGFHILKKQKMFLRSTYTSFLQFRDPRNHTIDWQKVSYAGYAAKNLTYSIFVVFKTVADPTITEVNGQITFGVTRKYSYIEDDDSVDASALNP